MAGGGRFPIVAITALSARRSLSAETGYGAAGRSSLGA